MRPVSLKRRSKPGSGKDRRRIRDRLVEIVKGLTNREAWVKSMLIASLGQC
jgi:hypothetical protein